MFKNHRLTLLFLAFCAIFVGMTGGAYYFDQEQARAGGFVRYSVSDHLVTPYRDRLGDARIASAIFEWRTQ